MRNRWTAHVAALSLLAVLLSGCTSSPEPTDPEPSQKVVDAPSPESPQSLPMSLLSAQGITESSIVLIYTQAEIDFYRAETSDGKTCLIVALRLDDTLGSRCADSVDFSSEGVRVDVASDSQNAEAVLVPDEGSFEPGSRFESVTDSLAIVR